MTTLELSTGWQTVCSIRDLVRHAGVVVAVHDQAIAIFYVPETPECVWAISHRDPISGAHILGHGLLGELGGRLVVAGPLYKQHFFLHDGVCLEQPELRIPVWPARCVGDWVQIYIDTDFIHARIEE